MTVQGVPRATGDLDVWIATDRADVDRVVAAFADLGAPPRAPGANADGLERPDVVVQ